MQPIAKAIDKKLCEAISLILLLPIGLWQKAALFLKKHLSISTDINLHVF
jgi:hypothetical protein